MSRATSKADADSEIEQVRAKWGVDDRQQNRFMASNLDASLAIISDQLYQQPSHFLLELIQNADDNTYEENVSPSLSLNLFSKDGRFQLLTNCNEVGFNSRDLIAICQLSKSTKIAGGGQRSQIGEKGIGFKSVFKVADVVHVTSGHYNFKFDRREHLGMVLPICSRFPVSQRRPRQTQFLLQLRDEECYGRTRADLLDIEPQLLLFLRNLKELKIKTESTARKHTITACSFDPELSGESVTLNSSSEPQGSSTSIKYAVVRHSNDRMPVDEKARDGISKSEVILAFPIGDAFTPKISSQKAFAFLPIDDFGFSFLLQADFLLVANREGLDYGKSWNTALRKAIQECFTTAVDRFLKIPLNDLGQGLRYRWPKYLRYRRGTNDFWNLLHDGIIYDLRDRNILESQDPGAAYRKPKELWYIDAKFRFQDAALFDCSSLRKKHLSFQYDGLYADLRQLGVQKTKIQDMAEEFLIWINEGGVSQLGAMSMEWHERVASIFVDKLEQRSFLITLRIVPLRDGSWVKPDTRHLYLASDSGDDYVPNGISISIVDQSASQSPIRRRFYEFLGIRTYTAAHICALITELHACSASRIKDRAREDMLRDAAYLFKNRFLHGGITADIYFMVNNQNTTSNRKTQIYAIDPSIEPNLVEKYKNTPRNPFYILDSEYERFICGRNQVTRQQLWEWLVQSKKIYFFPQLVYNSFLGPEWIFLREMDVYDLLLAVKHECATYHLNDRLLNGVLELEVACRDGKRRKLAEVAIPTADLVRECPHIPFADLPNPASWLFLGNFGIPTTPSAATSLRELVILAGMPPDAVDRSVVLSCYRRLSSSWDANEMNRIRDAFNSTPMVFVSRPSPRWVSHQSCVWNAPSLLKRVIVLASRYQDCAGLFQTLLGVRSAGIKHITDEVCSLGGDSSEAAMLRCKELLLLLKEHISDASVFTARHLLRIRYAQIFPVTLALENTNRTDRNRAVTLKAIQDGDWYIPDRSVLYSAFRDEVDMLKFSVHSVRLLDFLFGRLNYRQKYLSYAVKEKVIPTGVQIHDRIRERQLTIRLRCISYLKSELGSGLRRDIKPLRVFSVPDIEIQRKLEVNRERRPIVKTEKGESVTFQEGADCTKVFFRENLPPSKESGVNFKLAELFSSLMSINPEEQNLLIHLLSAELSELPHILEDKNIFLSEEDSALLEIHNGDVSNPMDIDTIDLVGELPGTARPANGECSENPIVIDAALSLSPLPLGNPTSITQDQTLDQNFLSSVRSNANRVASHARQFRIGKPQAVQGRRQMRTREETSRLATTLLTVDLLGSTSSSQDRRANLTENLRRKTIGFLGEYFIYELFKAHISDWSEENWTSRLRSQAGYSNFQEQEGKFSDLTYLDRSGEMRNYLRQAGIHTSSATARQVTYHFEVKTTSNGCDEPFSVSQNQLEMMRTYHDSPSDTYILFRVYNIESEDRLRDFKMYHSPWGLYLSGDLKFTSRNGYSVCAANASEV